MLIDNKQVPTKEGYTTKIHLCSNCKDKAECDAEEYINQGWCYTMDLIKNAQYITGLEAEVDQLITEAIESLNNKGLLRA